MLNHIKKNKNKKIYIFYKGYHFKLQDNFLILYLIIKLDNESKKETIFI